MDTTIMNARQITYSPPISPEMFRGYLPDRVRLFFDNFRTLHISVVQLGEMLNKCGDCKQIKAEWTEADAQRDRHWESLSKEDVAEMRPLKPVPVPPPAAAAGPVNPPPDNKPTADTSISNPFRGFFGR